MTNGAYAKSNACNGNGLLCSILCHYYGIKTMYLADESLMI